MTTVYRTAGAWGAGAGADLTPAQVDTNFYDKETRITALEGAGVGVGIESITVSGDQMTVTLTDSSVQGPFTLPAVSWAPKGMWAASTLYSANDIIQDGNSLYLVNFNHTSATSFDPAETLGTAGDIYTLIWTFSSAAPGFTRTGSTFTPALEDAGSYNRMTNAAGATVTIDGAVAFEDWTEIHFRDESTDTGANVSFTVSGGASINGVAGYSNATLGTGATVTLKKVGATNTWDIMGLLATV